MVTVPVLVDDVKRYSGFEMTRCTYFSVACDSPTPTSFDGLGGTQIQVLMLGGSRIVYKPLGRKRLFREAEQITELFRSIEPQDEDEREEGLFVDVDDVWLPNCAFDRAPKGALARGAVFRVTPEIFRLATEYRAGRISSELFEAAIADKVKDVRYSKSETAAFRKWSSDIIDSAKRQYPKRPEFKLKWTEAKQ